MAGLQLVPFWVVMSESAIPKTWADARDIILANAPWSLLLVAIERAIEGHLVQAAVALILCFVALGIAIYWKVFEGLGRRGGRRRLSFVLIFIGFTILASGIYLLASQPRSVERQLAVTSLCSDGPCAPVRMKPGPEYLKEIGLGTGGAEPLVLQATPVITGGRLQIAVDYSEYRSGWMPKTRAVVGDIREPLKGKIERVQLIYVAVRPNGGVNNLWWGDPSQGHPVTASTIYDGSPMPASVVRGRLAIIGPSGEQHHYFILIREALGAVAGTQVGIIPQHDSGDWIDSWEAD
jgi:hypothetical protein